jgi:lysophospholipase L1-like esterase
MKSAKRIPGILLCGVSMLMLSTNCSSVAKAETMASDRAAAIGTKWVGTWAASPYLTEPGNMPPVSLSNATLRQVVRVSLGGSQIRLKFSNRCGTAPLVMKAVHLAVSAGGDEIEPETDMAVTFGGKGSATVTAGGEMISDSLNYSLPSLTNMAITIYFGEAPSKLTGHPGSRTSSYIQGGNVVSSRKLTSPSTTDHWYIISGIDIVSDGSYKAVACLGDSITDGRGTTTNAQNRWTDLFATRLQGNLSTQKVGVLNQGIGGTLVTGSGLERFDRDVLGQSGVRYLIVLYGVNDIIYAGSPSGNVISAYKALIKKAHTNGLLAYGGTIPPFGGFSEYTASRESVRQAVNEWLRTTGADKGGFDASIDFDAALRDPAAPTKLLKAYDSGDGLHPGPAGYQKIAETIDLTLFGK